MSDNIELVIKINKDIAQDIINGENDEPRNIVRAFQATIAAAIKYGTPLPKGHWVRVSKDKLRCSECDVIHFIAQYPLGQIAWCPNCGADMRGEKE